MRIQFINLIFALTLVVVPKVVAQMQGPDRKPPSSGTKSPSPVAEADKPDSTGKSKPAVEDSKRTPKRIPGAADLPTGWRITPAGRTLGTLGDLITNFTVSPDGEVLIAVNSGLQPNGLTVFDAKTEKQLQTIQMHSAWLGLVWSSDGHILFVSGGNGSLKGSPIYEFAYKNGRLSEAPVGEFEETISSRVVWWSGLAYLPGKDHLYAANRGADCQDAWNACDGIDHTQSGNDRSNVVVFDIKTRQVVTRIPVESTPYQLVLSPDGQHLFVSNWSSQSVSVIDTNSNQVIRSLHVGMNPNDMKLSSDGRLFVACSNDNTVYAIDTHTLRVIERLSTTLTPFAPEGSTPDAMAIDNKGKLLYIANADNNSVAVVNISERSHSTVMGFIPTGWYPSALALTGNARKLYVGNSLGEDSRVNNSPKNNWLDKTDVGSIEAVSVANLEAKLRDWTHRVMENTPYDDSMLSEAHPSTEPSIIPQRIGEVSPIQHVIYVIKENKSYDLILGDLPRANGDAQLAIFGEKVTPNQHALAKEYVTLDNLYCGGQTSMDGHSWTDAAYATDYNEKQWPSQYGGHSDSGRNVDAMIPSGGFIWDLARRKGLTYRSYGETSVAGRGKADSSSLIGHMDPIFEPFKKRDTENVAECLREFKEYEANYNSSDPEKRLPNLTIVWLPEDHTSGTTPGAYTPQAMVANNDYALGQLVDGVTHSRYWPNTAIFVIEDDSGDGVDHVDGRRTVGFVVSPYVKRGIVDSTLYSTSSMLRSMELLLGMPPMSQYDAAATPMYASFGTTATLTPFNVIKPPSAITLTPTALMFHSPRSNGALAPSEREWIQVVTHALVPLGF